MHGSEAETEGMTMARSRNPKPRPVMKNSIEPKLKPKLAAKNGAEPKSKTEVRQSEKDT